MSAGELTCRVEDEGLVQVARRLALTPALVRAGMRGAFRLSPLRVLALRDGVDLEWFLDAWLDACRLVHPNV